jgi:hypothetical protein
LAIAALLLAAVTMTTAVAAVSGACAPTKKKFKVSFETESTSSQTYVNVDETNISFTQGGSSPSCVIVFFSAEANISGSDTTMVVRAEVDGESFSCEPTGAFFLRSGATSEPVHANAMNFVCPDVDPGAHVVRIQFRRDGTGSVTLGFRTTIVNFK